MLLCGDVAAAELPTVNLRSGAGIERMRKFLSLLFGLGIGWAIGALLVAFFAPLTSDELREHWREHVDRALAAGRAASAKRRAELEQELKDLGKD